MTIALRRPAFAVLVLVLLATTALLIGSLRQATAGGVTVAEPFDEIYSANDLGSVPGVPTSYGGHIFHPTDPNVLLIGGRANSADGALYAIELERDADSHITGFIGEAEQFAEAPYNDGGMAFGPEGVLFLARWNVNQVGQIKPGSTAPDKVVDLAPLGVETSVSGLNFVPAGFPGAGQLKIITYGGGLWYTLTIEADGDGTFNIPEAEHHLTLPGGPEQFTYVPPGSPLFQTNSMLLAEYSAGRIAVYELDDNGDPLPKSRRDFITGLSGAEGAVIDPLTGDFLFSTFGGGNRIVVVQGFATPSQDRYWGDVDCDGTVAIGDALKIARHLLGLSVSQTQPCPPIDDDALIDDFPRTWGDVDCDGTVAIGDALKTARWLISLSVSQEKGCPEIGSEVTVSPAKKA